MKIPSSTGGHYLEEINVQERQKEAEERGEKQRREERERGNNLSI